MSQRAELAAKREAAIRSRDSVKLLQIVAEGRVDDLRLAFELSGGGRDLAEFIRAVAYHELLSRALFGEKE